MMLRRCLSVFLLAALCLPGLVACTSAQDQPVSLASFTENYVDVLIFLEHDSEGNHILSATFTPPEGYHLYSKDLPLSGIDGLGRPTLVELTSHSAMKATGTLIDEVKAEAPDFGPKELLVYPAGAVTLRLPVELPSDSGWIEDEIQVTYMACSASQCKPPVVAKHILIPIPCADMSNSE